MSFSLSSELITKLRQIWLIKSSAKPREKFLLPTLHMTLTCPQLCSGRQTADDADKHHLVMTFYF